MEDSTLKARAICNPASSGGGHEPTELRQEIEGYQLESITTQSPGDASEAAKSVEPAVFAVIPQALRVVVGPGYVPEL
jgi:diacylglycerol kinase family enzyme